MMALIAATLFIIRVHGIDGRVIDVNSHEITSLQSRLQGEENKLLHERVRCVIYLADGRFVSVIEDCDTVLKMLQDSQ